MKKLIPFLVFGTVVFATGSCDKIEDPMKPAVLLDTNLYPGNWDNYIATEWPVFGDNPNTERNVLLEDYTGHRCPNCPAAALVAKNISAADPDRVFVASIHAGPGGITSFQDLASDCGNTVTNPNNEFCTEFYCNESITYGETFQSGFGFFGNPQGTINRKLFSGNMFLFSTDWQTSVDQILTENDLKVNIQAESNYYSETNGFFLHVQTEFLEDLSANDYNLVVYLIENEKDDFQDSMSVILEDYHHHNIFRGCLDELAWGRSITGTKTIGDKTNYDYSYALPTGTSNLDYHLLIYVYDVATYEVLQVIKHEIN